MKSQFQKSQSSQITAENCCMDLRHVGPGIADHSITIKLNWTIGDGVPTTPKINLRELGGVEMFGSGLGVKAR